VVVVGAAVFGATAVVAGVAVGPVVVEAAVVAVAAEVGSPVAAVGAVETDGAPVPQALTTTSSNRPTT
jgi:hypothetical protein